MPGVALRGEGSGMLRAGPGCWGGGGAACLPFNNHQCCHLLGGRHGAGARDTRTWARFSWGYGLVEREHTVIRHGDSESAPYGQDAGGWDRAGRGVVDIQPEALCSDNLVWPEKNVLKIQDELLMGGRGRGGKKLPQRWLLSGGKGLRGAWGGGGVAGGGHGWCKGPGAFLEGGRRRRPEKGVETDRDRKTGRGWGGEGPWGAGGGGALEERAGRLLAVGAQRKRPPGDRCEGHRRRERGAGPAASTPPRSARPSGCRCAQALGGAPPAAVLLQGLRSAAQGLPAGRAGERR